MQHTKFIQPFRKIIGQKLGGLFGHFLSNFITLFYPHSVINNDYLATPSRLIRQFTSFVDLVDAISDLSFNGGFDWSKSRLDYHTHIIEFIFPEHVNLA